MVEIWGKGTRNPRKTQRVLNGGNRREGHEESKENTTRSSWEVSLAICRRFPEERISGLAGRSGSLYDLAGPICYDKQINVSLWEMDLPHARMSNTRRRLDVGPASPALAHHRADASHLMSLPVLLAISPEASYHLVTSCGTQRMLEVDFYFHNVGPMFVTLGHHCINFDPMSHVLTMLFHLFCFLFNKSLIMPGLGVGRKHDSAWKLDLLTFLLQDRPLSRSVSCDI